VNAKLNALLPTYFASYGQWDQGGRQGPMPVPNMVSSQSDNVRHDVLVTPAAYAAVRELNAPGREHVSAGPMPASSHSVNTCVPAIGGASTLAELDALEVTKSRN
jgi:hypothetical protein